MESLANYDHDVFTLGLWQGRSQSLCFPICASLASLLWEGTGPTCLYSCTLPSRVVAIPKHAHCRDFKRLSNMISTTRTLHSSLRLSRNSTISATHITYAHICLSLYMYLHYVILIVYIIYHVIFYIIQPYYFWIWESQTRNILLSEPFWATGGKFTSVLMKNTEP